MGGLVTGLFNIAIGVPSLQGLGSQGGRFSGPTGAKAATNTPATTAATQATDLNKGIKAPVQQRPPGTSLFDPAAGALACNGGGDVCLEILRPRSQDSCRLS